MEHIASDGAVAEGEVRFDLRGTPMRAVMVVDGKVIALAYGAKNKPFSMQEHEWLALPDKPQRRSPA